MSQQRATEQNPASSSNNNSDVITLDDDDEDDVIAIVGPPEIIDLCLSPSTSAAAAAAAAARSDNGTADHPGEESGAGSGSGDAVAASNPNSPASSPGDAASPAAAALECPICLQTCIHPARLPCGHIFCFLCVKGVAYKNRRCAMCRREIPAEFLDHPQLVNGIEDICTTRATEDGYQWYYEGRNGGWWAYDSRTNESIESAYDGYQRFMAKPPSPLTNSDPGYPISPRLSQDDEILDISSESDELSIFYSGDLNNFEPHPSRLDTQICGIMYIIDFIRMKQYPQSNPGKHRNILRCRSTDVPGGSKGIAGLIRHRYI
ncbi:uncharacterized protein LOC108108795 isoform X3 [Drosophila eugracilis]|uniref:uncharacterized protein LOC108108795 isoform X3 n=1 Tax=Drosophila eugracilis TaxID=29029 RepID=UPI0007E75097|nr:uncharacterized protein LOC108108795 isoform X3 [Drosophila eugracilis]